MRNAKKENHSKFTGILLVILGGAFLLNNFNLIPIDAKHYFFNWKGLILAMGLVLLATKNRLQGMIMTVIGAFFILSAVLAQEFNIQIHFREIFIPVLLIIVGLVVLSKRRPNISFPNISFPKLNSTASFDQLNDMCLFGGGDKKVRSGNFQGGQTTAIFGGGNYDMSGSTLAEGKQTLEIFALFGGVTFVMPSDWDIQIQVTSLFGGFSDNRKFLKTSADPSKQLRIIGFVIFGGGELKNY